MNKMTISLAKSKKLKTNSALSFGPPNYQKSFNLSLSKLDEGMFSIRVDMNGLEKITRI